MSFPSMIFLLCLWLSPAVAYKLPLLDEDGALLTDGDNTIGNTNSPFGTNHKWEWQSQDKIDDVTLLLARLRREIIDKKLDKGKVKPYEKILPKVEPTNPPVEEISDSTLYILEASSAAVTESVAFLKKDETTPLNDLEQISKEVGQNLDEDKTTPLNDLEQTTKGTGQKLIEEETTSLTDIEKTSKEAGKKFYKYETTNAGKSIAQSETLVTKFKFNPTTSQKLFALTTDKYNKVTKANQVHSTDRQDTSSLPPKSPTPSLTSVISQELTTEHDVTTVKLLASSSSSAKPASVTHITTLIEDKVHTQYILRHCMLTILILAVVCTIFIISTIALVAKLSTMKQKNKLRHPATYTEMRCISSLLPDSDQQNKPRPKKLKTFASNMEESDGDNTTLNSFLPDH